MQAHDSQQAMNEALQHMALPDTAFFYNSGDHSVCRGSPSPCALPMLGHTKVWGGSLSQPDILVPQLHYMPSELHYWPWSSKEPSGACRRSCWWCQARG